jgi:hypothetical protein
MTLVITEKICNVAFINVISKIIISKVDIGIVKVSNNAPALMLNILISKQVNLLCYIFSNFKHI